MTTNTDTALPPVAAQLTAGVSNEYRQIFATLVQTDCSKHVEKKNGMSYLSWAYAIDSLLRVAPDASFKVCEFGGELVRNLVTGELLLDEFGDVKVHNGEPFQKTAAGYFVKAKVKVTEVTREMRLPVLDNRNKPIAEPSAFDINSSGMRCLTKAIAMHGLGLFLYQGEDVPATNAPPAVATPPTLRTVPAAVPSADDPFSLDKLPAPPAPAAAANGLQRIATRIQYADSKALRAIHATATDADFPDPRELAEVHRLIAARARSLGINLQPLAAVA